MNLYLKGKEKAIFEATWQWILDHSELKPDGQLFVKAQIKSKESFQGSIKFRMKGGYRDVFKTDEEIANRRNEHLKKAIANNLKLVEEHNRKIINKKHNLLQRLFRYLSK